MSLAACGGSSSGPGGNHEPKPDPITTPDSFSFAPQEGLTLGELVESNTITLGGITAAASISISNGEYKLGDGDYTDEDGRIDRKSTRLNSSHVAISYAVFCLKKKIFIVNTLL